MLSERQIRAASFALRAVSLACFLIAIEQPAKADPVTAMIGSSAIGAGTSILGGIFGGSARKKAAQLQAEAMKNAAARIDQTTENVNRDITGAARSTGEQLRQTAGETGTQLRTAAGEAITRNDEATTGANLLLNPYRTAGDHATSQLDEGLAPGGDFNKTPTLADLQIDPGYAFRMQQGQQALERSAAAKGGALGGGAVKDTLSFAQGLGSQEYKNAFDRFRQTTQDRFGRLFDTSGRGMAAAGTQGDNLIGGARYGGDLNYRSASDAGNLDYRSAADAGNLNYGAAVEAGRNSTEGARTVGELMTGRAEAQGAGIVGQSNSIWGGINNGVNGITQSLQLKNLLKNPATARIPGRP